MKWGFSFLLLSVLFFFSPSRVRAQAVTIVANGDQFFVTNPDNPSVTVSEITVQINVGGNGTGYLRAAFSKEPNSSPYFGCTGSSGASQYCGTTCTQFPGFNSQGPHQLSIRVKDPAGANPSGFTGSGDYYLQVGRCTSDGGGFDWSAPVEVHIDDQSPGPTVTPTPTATPTVAPTSTPTPTPVPQPGNISLNEFVACAPGPEWVELYNGNDSEVTLADWKIKDDKDNVSHINGTIGAKGWATFDVSNLNNDFDTVRLYNGAGFAVESKHYDTCISTQSWAKTSSGSWQQTSIVTKGGVNKFPTPVPTSTPTPSPSITPSPSASPTSSPEILGESTESGIPTLVVSEQTAESIASKSSAVKKESPLFAILAILLGIISLLTLGGYLWYDWKKKKGSSVISQ